MPSFSCRTMLSFSVSFISVALLAFSQLCNVASIPLSTVNNEISARSTPTGPHWVIYSDEWAAKPPTSALLSGFNTFILGFYLVSGPMDNAIAWMQLTKQERDAVKADYAAAGISLMISAFGSTETPTTSNVDPVDMANKLAEFVIQYDLDGVDVDYEDFDAWNAKDGRAEKWLIALTKQLRAKLPAGQYILTHAPIGAWFPSDLWSGGGYEAVDKAVGSMIDWYNIQYYSQNADQYVTCAGLLDHSTQYPGSAVFEISASGVPLEKLVIGKPATTADATDFITAEVLAPCMQQAKAKGWTAGAMLWEYPHAGSAFITAARALSWPVSGGGGAPPPVTTSSIIVSSTQPVSTNTGSGDAPPPVTTSSSLVSNTDSSTTSTTSSSLSRTTSSTEPSGSGKLNSSTLAAPPSSPSVTTSATGPTTTGGSCGSASAWVNSATYVGGTSVTYNGHLWTAKWWNNGVEPAASTDGWADVWADKGAC